MKTASRRRKATEAGTAIRMISGNSSPVEAVFSVLLLAEVVGVTCCESGTWDKLFPDGDVSVVASDGGDVVAGGGVVVGGGDGVMMVLCGHAELLVWNITSARYNQRLEVRKSRPRNCRVYLVCMQYLTKCSQEVTWM